MVSLLSSIELEVEEEKKERERMERRRRDGRRKGKGREGKSSHHYCSCGVLDEERQTDRDTHTHKIWGTLG